MNLGTIVIRADASIEVGTGHVMRCMALAQAWQDAGGEAIFVSAVRPGLLRARLSEENFEQSSISASIGTREDALETLKVARCRGASWIILDGYSFDSDYQRVVRSDAARLAIIDDIGQHNSYADVIINQNLHARESMYSGRQLAASLLLGPKFALLRREFKRVPGWDRNVPAVGKHLLVSMGGTDPANMSLRVLDALRSLRLPGLEVRVAVTSSNPRIEELTTACQGLLGTQLALDADMPELMAWADIAIAAAGLICWEMCFMGLPALLIDVARNQKPIAHSLSRDEISVYLGNSDEVTSQAIADNVKRLLRSQRCREAMSRRARKLVDGAGAGRIVAKLQHVRRSAQLDVVQMQ